MAVIIVEGPDFSGKTTFVKHLAGWLGPDQCRVQKSPAGKATVWEDAAYSNWAETALHTSRRMGKIFILDRTPEISETVYGPILRKQNRLSNPTTSLLTLRQPGVVTVFMVPQRLGGPQHTDPQGNEITVPVHLMVSGGYEVIKHMMAKKGARVTHHDFRNSPPQWVSGFIIRNLALRMTVEMEPQKMDEYLEKGDQLLWT